MAIPLDKFVVREVHQWNMKVPDVTVRSGVALRVRETLSLDERVELHPEQERLVTVRDWPRVAIYRLSDHTSGIVSLIKSGRLYALMPPDKTYRHGKRIK